MEVILFLADVRQCNIAFSVVHVQVIYNISFVPARVAANSIKRICASVWFVWMENNNCTPNPNNYVWEHFKNIRGWNPQNV